MPGSTFNSLLSRLRALPCLPACLQVLPSGGHPWTVEERMRNFCDALLTEFDFFTKPASWTYNMLNMLNTFNVSAAPACC